MTKTTKSLLTALPVVVLLGLLVWFFVGRDAASAKLTIRIDGDSALYVRNMATHERALPVASKPGLSTLSAHPGELLRIQGDGVSLYYPYRAEEPEPLVFTRSGFRTYLNGKLVGLDLSSRAAMRWFVEADKDDLALVCSVSLVGYTDGSCSGLDRLPSSTTYVFSWDDFRRVLDMPLGLSCQGLVLLSSRGDTESEESGALDDLSRLSKFRNLRLLSLIGCEFTGGLGPLQELTKLEYLTIQHSQSVSDLKPIAKLPNLRVLNLAGCPMI